MNATSTALSGVLTLQAPRHVDHRGHFTELMHERWLEALPPGTGFLRTALSHNRLRGTVRGLHMQRPPHAVGKLVQVTQGAVLDVVVDLRPGSATWGEHIAIRLSAENATALWIPPGCAHGFCTLEDSTDVLYHLTGDYAPDHQAGIRWDDPSLGIDWPVTTEQATLSDRDRALPLLQYE